MNQSIVFLKFLAALFITNSHFIKVYPHFLAYLATAGSLGNSLFFFVSGFTLINSNKKNFDKWFLKRIIRIYPQVILVTLTLHLLSERVSLANYVYPTLYWFVNAILLFYILYYFIPKTKEFFSSILILLFAPYFFIYFNYLDISQFVIEVDYFRWIFYFQIMLFGGIIALEENPTGCRLRDCIFLISLFILYFGVKLLSIKFSVFYRVQFLQHLLTFPMIYYLYQLAKSDFVINNLMKTKNKKIIVGISSITLEIYLVQFYIIEKFSKIAFPLNIIIVSALIIVSAYIVNKLIKSLIEFFAGNDAYIRGKSNSI